MQVHKNPSYREPAETADPSSNITTVGVSVHYFFLESAALKPIVVREKMKYDVRSEDEIMADVIATHGRGPERMHFSLEYYKLRMNVLSSLLKNFVCLHSAGEDIIVNTALISHVKFDIDP